jgi:hypothetical protein
VLTAPECLVAHLLGVPSHRLFAVRVGGAWYRHSQRLPVTFYAILKGSRTDHISMEVRSRFLEKASVKRCKRKQGDSKMLSECVSNHTLIKRPAVMRLLYGRSLNALAFTSLGARRLVHTLRSITAALEPVPERGEFVSSDRCGISAT